MRAFASPLPAVFLLAICFGPPSAALAQDFTISATGVSVGPRPITTNTTTPFVSGAECAGTITLRATRAVKLDVWRGAVGSNCNLMTNRTLASMPCTHIAYFASLDADNTFDLSITEMMKGATACNATDASGSGQTYEFFFIQSESSGNTTTETPFAKLPVRVDASRPVAVTIPDGRTNLTGESVSVSWTPATGETETIAYRVYTDTAGTCTGDGGGTSSTLVPGELPASGLTFRNAPGASSTISPETVGSEIGSSVVVAIAAVDVAGNVGKLSPLVCVSFVETEGFCDDNEDCSKNCAVRMPGSARDEGVPFALLALASLGVVVHARRRRSAK